MKKFFTVFVVLVATFALVGCDYENQKDGGNEDQEDAGFDACYFKDPGLGLPGCPQESDACVLFNYSDVCIGQCGQADDGCGGYYLCICN